MDGGTSHPHAQYWIHIVRRQNALDVLVLLFASDELPQGWAGAQRRRTDRGCDFGHHMVRSVATVAQSCIFPEWYSSGCAPERWTVCTLASRMTWSPPS
jgi:hypothetical protein